ncbi:NADase-type glycan-binding domain-containing protein [Ensifer aridi]|uniref:NADase-type glycan-binding domain-containing protein n=1 Tax=Ensifer aridi TaxID=1708715 RepID=UPI000A10CA3D|nr:caspase family protein [Ensifer aridi]
MRKAWHLVVLALLVLSWHHALADERRVALVMGNDEYQSIPALAKAVNDAKGVGHVLQDIGFDLVIEATNVNRREMNRKISEFARAVREGDTAFFFYAGHGVAVGSVNYLLPVDFPAIRQNDDEELIRDDGKSADDVIALLQDRKPGRIFMVLDACRENPLQAGGRSIGRNSGLSAETAPGTGVFMLFSAANRQVALDGLGDDDVDPNSVFTRMLIPLLKKPGLSQVTLAKALQKDVAALAKTVGHDQNPSYYDEIPGEFFLNSAPAVEARVDSARGDPQDGDLMPTRPAIAEQWELVKDSKSEKVLRAFIEKYPDEIVLRSLAEERLASLVTKPVVPVPDIPYASCAKTMLGAVRGTVCATSVLEASAGNSYRSANLGDGALSTAWVEGSSGDGIGESIVVSFDEARTITKIALVNGYAKSSDIFRKNSRVRDLIIRTSSGYVATVTLADTRGYQQLDLSTLENIDWFSLEIGNVYHGSRYTDTAISEIELE